MDLQTRKLKAIKYLAGIQDEKVFSKIESVLLEVQKQQKKNLKPLTQQQLIERANRSNMDYQSGKFRPQEELEQESENW